LNGNTSTRSLEARVSGNCFCFRICFWNSYMSGCGF
jgi:hypothetical protein